MKKFVSALIVCLCCISCSDNYPIIGDYYIVESVEVFKSAYSTKYKIIAKPLNDGTTGKSILKYDNSRVYYTNSFYSVNDTIKLINLGSKSLDKEKNENS
jgi:hypothetical protein